MTPEGKVLADCLRWLTEQRKSGVPVNWFKVAGGPRQQAGQPDLLICWAGRFVAAEIKSPTGAPTKLQEHRLEEWRKAGAAAGIVRSVDDLTILTRKAVSDGRGDED
jgi:hypothetical protein